MSSGITLLASIAPTTGIALLLEEKLRICTRVRGVVAYWSLSVKALSGELSRALDKPGSFYCVHMERPTDIDKLADFVRGGADICLYTYELAQEAKGEEGGPAGLMHAKMILFDLSDTEAELWIGSHNFTSRALYGANTEASVSIRIRRDSNLYKEAESFLHKIRARSVWFDLEDVDYYRLLMGNYSEDLLSRLLRVNDKRILMRKAIDLVGHNVMELHGQTIQLIGINTGHLMELNRSNQLLIIAALDMESNQECIYVAKVRQAGIIDPKNKKLYGTSTEPRRYALLGRNAIGFLQKEDTIEENLLNYSDYFVNLVVLPFEVEKSYYVPEEILWEPATDHYAPLYHEEVPMQVGFGKSAPPPYRKASLDKEKLKNELSLTELGEAVRKLVPEFYKKLTDGILDSKGRTKESKEWYEYLTRDIPPVLYRENSMAGRRIALYKEPKRK